MVNFVYKFKNQVVRVTFLGTGTSQGVPVIACHCMVCQSTDSRDKRLRTSILIEHEDKNIVIDSGPDFRQQMLRSKVDRLDAIVLTHEHKDHIAGLDDIRAFNHIQQKPTDIFAEQRVQRALKQEFAYIFAELKYPGIPQVSIHTIDNKNFTIGDIPVIPIRAMHLRLPILGFRIADFTYITDANFISTEEKEKIVGSRYLVLNGLRKQKHISHFSLNEAVKLIEEINPEEGFITHISHQLGLHKEVQAELPPKISLAYDGLVIDY